jgi:hypothetical protein
MLARPSVERDFLGTIVKRRSVPGLRLTETILPQHSRTPKHFHDRGLLGWSIKGSYTKRLRPSKPGDSEFAQASWPGRGTSQRARKPALFRRRVGTVSWTSLRASLPHARRFTSLLDDVSDPEGYREFHEMAPSRIAMEGRFWR